MSLPSFLIPIINHSRAFKLTLSGETIDNTLGDPSCFAGVHVNANGTLEEIGPAAVDEYTQIDSATDWVFPNAMSNRGFHFKCENAGDALAAGSDNIDEWLPLGTGLSWYYEDTNDIGIDTGEWTISVSADGGSTTADSGTFTVTARKT
jgi:hypothetical protein